MTEMRYKAHSRFVVTSPQGANGDGYGALLAFDREGALLGRFSEDERISDPRGLAVDREHRLLFLNSGSDRVLALNQCGTVVRDTGWLEALNPGGGLFGPDGRLYIGLRSARRLRALAAALDSAGDLVLPHGVVPFPRGFAFAGDGRLFLASGVGPDGRGENTLVAFAPDGTRDTSWRVSDPQLSPLDLTIGPSGNIIVSSEFPFGSPTATTSVREYDPVDGRLIRVLTAENVASFRKPRGLRFGPEGILYCVAEEEVVVFDYGAGRCLGALVRLARLNGQAIAFFP